jgi:hypothetical protein
VHVTITVLLTARPQLKFVIDGSIHLDTHFSHVVEQLKCVYKEQNGTGTGPGAALGCPSTTSRAAALDIVNKTAAMDKKNEADVFFMLSNYVGEPKPRFEKCKHGDCMHSLVGAAATVYDLIATPLKLIRTLCRPIRNVYQDGRHNIIIF